MEQVPEHKAPNGKKSKLSAKQWLAVRTPSFKQLFGNWQHGQDRPTRRGTQ